jgi:hypothetical protein
MYDLKTKQEIAVLNCASEFDCVHFLGPDWLLCGSDIYSLRTYREAPAALPGADKAYFITSCSFEQEEEEEEGNEGEESTEPCHVFVGRRDERELKSGHYRATRPHGCWRVQVRSFFAGYWRLTTLGWPAHHAPVRAIVVFERYLATYEQRNPPAPFLRFSCGTGRATSACSSCWPTAALTRAVLADLRLIEEPGRSLQLFVAITHTRCVRLP